MTRHELLRFIDAASVIASFDKNEAGEVEYVQEGEWYEDNKPCAAGWYYFPDGVEGGDSIGPYDTKEQAVIEGPLDHNKR